MSSSDYSDDEEERSYRSSGNNNIHTSHAREQAQIVDRYSDKINLEVYANHRITRDKALRATVDQVLDPRTMRFLGKIFNGGIITKINGCVSTGKEANIYYAENETTNDEFAVKIYKTSILVFKDRTRYVVGEHRFGEKQTKNPRQMVKNWAEKEFRNLKRLHSEPLINSPRPVELRENILVMEYLTHGKGEPSPKLRDHKFEDLEEVIHYYHEMLILMRVLYQKCRLVHADLSEYNTIVHNDQLYVFDVSQSVEPDHPMAMDFLRMDIKNVNDFFNRIKKINVYAERDIFKYIISPHNVLFDNEDDEAKEMLEEYLNTLTLKSTQEDEFNDEVFRSLHLVSSLHNIEERDFNKFKNGDIDTLVDLVGSAKIVDENLEAHDEQGCGSDGESGDENAGSDEDDDASDSDVSEDDDLDDEDGNKINKLKRFQDKEEKKLHKQQVKEEAREKRKNKMKKNVKKKLVKKGKK